MKRIAFLVALFFAFAAPAFAQPSTCTITGTIYRSSGAVCASCQVTLSKARRGSVPLGSGTQTFTTNGSGVLPGDFQAVQNSFVTITGQFTIGRYNFATGLEVYIPSQASIAIESLQSAEDALLALIGAVSAAGVTEPFITKTATSGLSNEFALGSLATGILKNTTSTGVPTIAAAGTDYVAPGAATGSGLTMATTRMLGRSTASTGAIEEITVGSGLSLSGGTLSASGGSGTVTDFSAGDLSPLFTTSEANTSTTPALSFTLSNQSANQIFAGPTSGGAAAPTFRALVAADIPDVSATYQPLDSDLTAIAALSPSNDDVIQRKTGAWTNRTMTQLTADLAGMVGDSGSGGTKGLVPAPAAGDAAAGKFLKADGTWATAGGGLTIGTTTITSGTNTRVLYNNSGVVGEYTVTGSGNVAMSASPTFSGTLTAATIAPTGFISTPVSPSQLTADQNDYAGATGLINRLDSNSDSRIISGMAAGTDGQVKYDVNVGSFNIIYTNQSGNSSAANRFANSTGADLIIRPGEWVTRIYDGTTARWRVAAETQRQDTAWRGTWIQTSAEASAIVSGPNGTTNPVFRVINSTPSSATGLSITGNAAGSGVTITALSSGTNESFVFTPKGSGALTTSAGDIRAFASVNSVDLNAYTAGPYSTTSNVSVRVLVAGANGAGVRISSGYGYYWSSNAAGAGDAYGALDTGLVRSAAGVVRVSNASTGIGSILLGASTDSLTGNFTVMGSNAATNALVTMARIGVNSTGTAANGFGPSIDLSAETSTTNDTQLGSIAGLWTDATHASRTGAITFSTVSAAGSNAERLRVNHNGLTLAAVLFANLGSTNGILSYCSDCAVTSGADNTCAGSGSGALAIRLNGAWRCFIAQN